MGIPALWDTIKKYEECVLLAELAEAHHRSHGKPLRIAVDEADWRFNNLTQQQVYTIRQTSNQHAFQGIEKAMFYRICHFLTLNIQLIFVFDGPGRPWKRGKRGQGKIDYEERRLLQSVLNCLGVPYHEAPGEAEAECARLQILGIVDAVWSQDSDALMFGCTFLLNDWRVAKEDSNKDRSKENTKKSGKYARVIRTNELRELHGLDREGMVLFAMLVGGDYDTKGLPGCGPSMAMQAVKHDLGRSLCACRNQRDCSLWGIELATFLQTSYRGRSIPVPPTYPDYKILHKYNHPKVNTDLDLLNRSRLKLDYIRPIQELELLEVTSKRFDIWGRLYMNWVAPVLLMRYLVARDPSQPKEIVHDIRLTKRRVTKDEPTPTRIFERKLTFSPFGVSDLSRTDFEDDHLGYWNGDYEVLFDPEYRVECEIPEYWLRKVLPRDVFEPSTPVPTQAPKRKRQVDHNEEGAAATNSTKRRHLANEGPRVSSSARSRISTTPMLPSERSGMSVSLSQRSATPSTSQNTPMSKATKKLLSMIELSESEDEEDLGLPPTTRPTKSSLDASKMSHIVELSFSEPTTDRDHSILFDDAYVDRRDEEDEELQLALRLSMQDQVRGPIPPANRGGYGDIFAMREEGRNVEGYSVPAWSLDETNVPSTPTSPQPSIRQVSRNSTQRSVGRPRGTHANSISLNPVEVPAWYFAPPSTQDPTTSATLPRKPTKANGDNTNANVPSSNQPTLSEMRAARLQRFETSSAVTTQETNKPQPSPVATGTSKRRASPYKVPVGSECIDLTDD
ncbi:XPG-I multi-domain protein [Pyrenophora tritici-repentis]|nr:XPG-I multi-domain protein [Pyrenophora tritici-repentis]